MRDLAITYKIIEDIIKPPILIFMAWDKQKPLKWFYFIKVVCNHFEAFSVCCNVSITKLARSNEKNN